MFITCNILSHHTVYSVQCFYFVMTSCICMKHTGHRCEFKQVMCDASFVWCRARSLIALILHCCSEISPFRPLLSQRALNYGCFVRSWQRPSFKPAVAQLYSLLRIAGKDGHFPYPRSPVITETPSAREGRVTGLFNYRPCSLRRLSLKVDFHQLAIISASRIQNGLVHMADITKY